MVKIWLNQVDLRTLIHINLFMIGWKGGVRTPWTPPLVSASDHSLEYYVLLHVFAPFFLRMRAEILRC